MEYATCGFLLSTVCEVLLVYSVVLFSSVSMLAALGVSSEAHCGSLSCYVVLSCSTLTHLKHTDTHICCVLHSSF